ncbi:hypothetical protein TRIUR3_03382 [Triticum urartu]|uniref:Uncharacterized protein n=1 Tax=Triticum urartu TaxID=4572 RepID=M7ZYJ3_TRIUA|nr:hypothetical protein TRIUR3_03382 [Triticum urartu]
MGGGGGQFYRIHVGIQSPEGVSSSHGVLRRFSDFLKLCSDLKRAFPRKDIPPAPPKHAFLRINSSRLLLEERRNTLEEWMQKLLSDIDLSRSAHVAAFLELEAAARSYFQDWNQRPPEAGALSEPSQINPGLVRSISLTGVTGNGVLGESISGQSDQHAGSVSKSRKQGLVFSEHDGRNGSVESSKGVVSEEDCDSNPGHARKDSSESLGSDLSSLRGSELSTPGASSSLWDGPVDVPSGVDGHSQTENLAGVDMQFLYDMDAQVILPTDQRQKLSRLLVTMQRRIGTAKTGQTENLAGVDMQFLYDMDAQVILPTDQRQKLSRLLVTMQRRIGTAKTDMEDLIARLNQEVAVKDYLSTKVKDLEGELEATKQKGRDTLHQAILAERERITQMQWDMDELRRKYSEMESNLKAEQDEKTRVESEKATASGNREELAEELETKRKEVESLQRQLGEVEAKSKTDMKVLVKEVKSLRNSQREMKKVLNQYVEEKTELERIINREKQRSARVKSSREKMLHECRLLRERLQECSAKFLAEEQDNLTVDPSSLPDALDLLATSDNRIRLLVAQLRMHLNSVIRNAVNTSVKPEKEDADGVVPKKTVLNWLLDR